MPYLTRDDFLTKFDVRCDLREVTLPDDNHVFIRQLTGAGADAFGAASIKSPELARATLVAACVCDAAGQPLFRMADAQRVSELPNRILTPITEAIIDHNGLRAEAAAAAVPTSATGPSSNCGSASPATSAGPSPK